MHGESFRAGIRELYQIRLNLMREKNPSLTPDVIDLLAAEQWIQTESEDRALAEELDGICQGSGLSRAQIVVLNNYTDFRDIQLADEGCSIVFVHRDAGPIAGQTWDMHGSAKNYVCCLQIPNSDSESQTIAFSLVGCVGMMGYTTAGTMVGVNNINTDGAVPGALWPVIVRRTLQFSSQPAMVDYLVNANVTSGHNYLVADRRRAEMWEVMPGLAECVSAVKQGERGHLFHTNHCLSQKTQRREQPTAQNSTTHIRYGLLESKVNEVNTFDDMYNLLNDHENYPKSICSNFQSSAQDPSVTCGGAVGDLDTGQVVMWRGDELYDANFKKHVFQLGVDP
jgi:isopenicillin-N N-acyltransferase-like protein